MTFQKLSLNFISFLCFTLPATSHAQNTDPQKLPLKAFRLTADFELQLDGQPVLLEKGSIIRAHSDASMIAIPVLDSLIAYDNGKAELKKQKVIAWVRYKRDYPLNGKKLFEEAGDSEPNIEFIKGSLNDYKDGRPNPRAWPPKGSSVKLKYTAFVKLMDKNTDEEEYQTVSVVKYEPYKVMVPTKKGEVAYSNKGGELAAKNESLFHRQEPPLPVIESTPPVAPPHATVQKSLPTSKTPDPKTELEAVADPRLDPKCTICKPGMRIPEMPSSEELVLAELKKLLYPMTGLHIGDCGSYSLLTGLRKLHEKAKNNSTLRQLFSKLNENNKKRIEKREPLYDEEETEPGVVPPPTLRTDYGPRDAVAIDVCVRTCVGEMGGQVPSREDGNMCRTDEHGKFDPTYQTAIVANVNLRKRASFSETGTPSRETAVSADAYSTFAERENDPILRDPFINVMTKEEQYSIFLTFGKHKYNHARILCPANSTGGNLIAENMGPGADKYYAGGANPYQPIEELDRKSFDNCFDQCADAVIDPIKFWERTNDFDRLFFASPPNWSTKDRATVSKDRPACARIAVIDKKTKKPKISKKTGKVVTTTDLTRCMDGRRRRQEVTTIGGKPLDKLRCMTFYTEEHVHERFPWEGKK